MIIKSGYINREVMKRLTKRAHYEHRTKSEGRAIIMALNKALMQIMKDRNGMNFGLFTLAPYKNYIYKEIKQKLMIRNLINKRK